MAELFNFTDELLEKNCLCCAVCKDILRPPIMLIENIGNICSSCFDEKHELMNWRYLNNYALENIIKMLKLPCKFKEKGCSERFSYEELILHQNNCTYRTKLCSMFEFAACDWEGNTRDFIDHFKNCHGDHVINFENNLFFLETSLKEVNLVKLLVMKHHTFILRMKTNLDKKKLYYMICSAKDDYSSSCEYSVKHKGSSENYIKTKSTILSTYHIYSDFDENIAVEVDLEALKKISHISDTITNIFKMKLEESPTEVLDEKMLHFFECPVCKNFMKPPIFQCQSGHSVCNMCRPRLEKCPTCRATFGSTRNYSLEGLTAGVQYPCIYHDSGCTEISLASQIVKHERECPFKPYNCPFTNCPSSGNQEAIINHMINFHFDSVIYSGASGYTETFRMDQNFYNKLCDRKCVIAFNHIFRLTCRRFADQCLMAVEIIGYKDESKTFIYEVAIIDMRRPEKKVIRTDYCLTEMHEDELLRRCITFPNTILSAYSSNGVVTYSFMIREK
ncbi:unnamed protein product [Phaedon cochleariae]|uniref:RING-type E3 ubiquitin transferase n=1 Tax=Phaedon cochleariae TaxID=80249 RepID=A0A9N9SIG1_PHACE|nr:unnamed protein product [Phaedon cochleariae]